MIVIKNPQTSQELTKKKHSRVMEVTVLLSGCGGNWIGFRLLEQIGSGFGSVVGADQTRPDRIWFRLIVARCSPDLCSLNRVGPQGGGPTPAPCAKYCPTGKPPTSFGLTSQRDSHPCSSALFAGVLPAHSTLYPRRQYS